MIDVNIFIIFNDLGECKLEPVHIDSWDLHTLSF